MPNNICIIANPISGKGRGTQIAKTITNHLKLKGYLVETNISSYCGHIVKLAKEAVQKKVTEIIVVGGDGSVNEIIPEIIFTEIGLSIFPNGSGNGIARHFNIPTDINKWLSFYTLNTYKKFDVIRFGKNYAFGFAGVGFDGLVAHRFANLKKRGLVSYLKIIAHSFFKQSTIPVTIYYETKTEQKKVFLLAVFNTTEYGNGAKVSPTSIPNDGIIELICIKKISWYKLPYAVYLLFNSKFNTSNLVSIQTVKQVKFKFNTIYAHIDGNPILLNTNELTEVKVEPSCIKIKCNDQT